MSLLLRLNVEVHHRSLRQVLFLPMQVEATMHSSASIVIALICGSLLLGACASERGPTAPTAARYKIEVLEHGIDPRSYLTDLPPISTRMVRSTESS